MRVRPGPPHRKVRQRKQPNSYGPGIVFSASSDGTSDGVSVVRDGHQVR